MAYLGVVVRIEATSDEWRDKKDFAYDALLLATSHQPLATA